MIWDQNQTNFLSFVELVMSYAEEKKLNMQNSDKADLVSPI